MKILKSNSVAHSTKTRMAIELDSDETLIAIKEGCFYRLGYPVEDVVYSETLTDSKLVTWCSIEQRWL